MSTSDSAIDRTVSTLPSDAERQAAARRRLKVLQAFVKGKRPQGDNRHNATEMRWTPFSVFNRKVVALEELSASSSEDEDNGDNRKRRKEVFEHAQYFLLGGTDSCAASSSSSLLSPMVLDLMTRASPSAEQNSSSDVTPFLTLIERRESAGTSVGDVVGSSRDGIDNTGNFHWPTEDITAAYFLNRLVSEETCSSTASVLCEIGAGCGLAGFAIAEALQRVSGAQPPTLVVVSDGNSRVVHALRRNAKRLLNIRAAGSTAVADRVRVCASKLPWQCMSSQRAVFGLIKDWLDEYAGTPKYLSTNKGRRTACLFGSDCLFFERFHDALASLVLAWFDFFMNHLADVEVKVLLFAPKRGGSLSRFVTVLNEQIQVKQMKSLAVRVTEDFDDVVTGVKSRVEGGTPPQQYNPDRHVPLLVTVYSEREHTAPLL